MLSRAWPTRQVLRSLTTRAHFDSARYSSTFATAKQHDPLRVLFCGADDFSIYSLRALHELQQKRADKIASIDVVYRPGKRYGRGMKKIRELPIKEAATELGLTLHEVDTFQDWTPPSPVDLIVTVSFGLLVPARIINEAKYGGLNVHPSLLPQLRGPAPIQHALLRELSHTGVTLQTMHPTRFDHGLILDQTKVAIPPLSQYRDLIKLLGPLGAQMLSAGIESGLFVPPLQDATKDASQLAPSHAPKILPEARHIDWSTWSAGDIILRDRVLGRLWDTTTYDQCMRKVPEASEVLVKGRSKRVTFSGPWAVDPSNDAYENPNMQTEPGLPVLMSDREKTPLGILTVDRQVIRPAGVTVEGMSKTVGPWPRITNVRTVNPKPLLPVDE
ncbi:hypothetical protein LTR08_007097 [Meristemomyces frigidus]|nr:hypothetical protein LTR08_007097 [Meristemomyces frigidus]